MIVGDDDDDGGGLVVNEILISAHNKYPKWVFSVPVVIFFADQSQLTTNEVVCPE